MACCGLERWICVIIECGQSNKKHLLSVRYWKKTYTSLTKNVKNLILEIKYEDVVENTSDAIDSLSSFLEEEPHDQINYILAKEKCPNKISLTKRDSKLKDIKKVASDKYIKLLDEMIINYENN